MEFTNQEEFNKIWEKFVKENARESYRAPSCGQGQNWKEQYLNTRRFSFYAETLRLWLPYRENYLLSKQK